MEPFKKVQLDPRTPDQLKALIKHQKKLLGHSHEPIKQTFKLQFPDLSDEKMEEIIDEALESRLLKTLQTEAWVNDKYTVFMNECEDSRFVRLSIKRNDKEVIHDWREIQQIKNLLVGEENEGFELYPAESRLVDTANQYHLFVFKDPKERMSVGYKQRLVDSQSNESAGVKQRPREEK